MKVGVFGLIGEENCRWPGVLNSRHACTISFGWGEWPLWSDSGGGRILLQPEHILSTVASLSGFKDAAVLTIRNNSQWSTGSLYHSFF
jgi:hypothetical protein